MLIHYPLFQEDDELDVGIRPGFFDEDQSEGEDALEELSRSARSVSRPFQLTQPMSLARRK